MSITRLPLKGSELTDEQATMPGVLIVVDQFPRALGGGERIALKLAALLPQYGYSVSILTFSAHPESSALVSPPCPIYVLPLPCTYNLAAMRAALELRRFLREQKIQIVQTFFESSDIWAGFVTKSLSKAKVIWSRRDMGILRARKHRIAYRLMSGTPDAVFAVSEQVRQYSIDIDHIAPPRVLTIYNGLDLAHWNNDVRPAKPLHEILVATVGNIRRVKGHDIFIRAAATIAPQFPNVSFSIAGEVLEPDYFTELETLIRDLGLTNRFHFAGNIPNPSEYLATAAIFVLPSRSEGFSNAIIEAMAASLPIVATNVGGNAEAVQDGISGIIIPPEDSAALAAAILQLLSDPPLATAMGAAGKALVAQKFTTEAMMNQITATYQKLLAPTRS